MRVSCRASPEIPETWSNIPSQWGSRVVTEMSVSWIQIRFSKIHPCTSLHSIIPLSKNCLRLLTSTQSTDVSIFVSLCNYMLTGHLHDYHHLSRYTDEIWMCCCFSLGNPAIHVSQLKWVPTLEMSLCVGKCYSLCFQITVKHRSRANISFPLCTFIFPFSHILTSMLN